MRKSTPRRSRSAEKTWLALGCQFLFPEFEPVNAYTGNERCPYCEGALAGGDEERERGRGACSCRSGLSHLVLWGVSSVTYSQLGCQSQRRPLFEPAEQLLQVSASEFPFEGFGCLHIQFLEFQQPLADLLQRAKIIGGEDLPLDYREVDFDLVEPTGMNGQMHQVDVVIGALQSFHGGGSAMGGSIIHDPKGPLSPPIRLLLPCFVDQPAKGFNAGGAFATAKDSGS